MSVDPDPFREMFDAIEPLAAEGFEEPPIRDQFLEPPVRILEPPPSKQEIENAQGDELMKIAAEEEKVLEDARKATRLKDTFLIRCPKGCQIRVKEQHRGRTGKCPRCQSEFVVPKKRPVEDE